MTFLNLFNLKNILIKEYMDNPEVLNSLNGFINKKTATRLLSVSKIMKYYITPKKFRDRMLKLDTSDLA